MEKAGTNRPSSVGNLDTLAQSGTRIFDQSSPKPLLEVYGNGTDLAQKNALKGRAKRKLLTQYLTRSLAEVAMEKGSKERAQKYWNSWHCQSKVIKAKGRIYGHYCKNRFCLVCLANRKADIINRYFPVLSQWEDPHFVTLTIRSIKATKLNFYVKEGMIRGFRKIRERCKKRNQRGKGPKLIGVKSLECNFNPVKRTYNPHFHILVPNSQIAQILKHEWLDLWTLKHAEPHVQKIQKVRNLEKNLIEIIKYGSKIFTEPDMKKRAKKKIPPKIYINALDNIFVAMQGHRLFERFGFNSSKGTNHHPPKKQLITIYEQMDFDLNTHDWINYQTGELLTGYVPPTQLLYLLEENIDIDLS